ncbi:PD-(D/E)XK nuclease family protein [uncultured Helicobacter sp.]|uniref:PD-(D/E)XK nuclease family protein n=1 Tax=uncultured Helicobacter sp. TaxID=175537 RepID=UPI00374FC12E
MEHLSLQNLHSRELLVFPSRRALLQHHKSEGICPPSMLLGEFFTKAVYYPNKSIIPTHLRKFILGRVLREYDRERVNLLERGLVFERKFLAYLQSSEFFLRFFDELFVHNISIDAIPLLDTYGEYEDHLRILQEVYERYCAFLEQHGWVYRSWDFCLAHLWLEEFSSVKIMLCGVLSPFELAILREVAKVCEVYVCFDVRQNTRGFWDIFDVPLELDSHFCYTFAYPSGALVAKTPLDSVSHIHAYSFLSRIEQVGAIRGQIAQWLERGVEPEEMSIVLPQEDFTRYLQVLDREQNFNYAMGKAFKHTEFYHTLCAQLEDTPQSLRACVAQSFDSLSAQEKAQYSAFKQGLDEIVYQYEAIHAFLDDVSFSEVAQSFLHEIEGLSVDDVYGGRIRVIGALESRGVALPYVILVDCNDGVIPHFRDNDLFLNTALRSKLGIPTTYDKEKLQVLYYKNLLLGAKEAVALCVQDDKNTPAHLLEELGCEVRACIQSIFEHTLEQIPTYKQERYVGRLHKVFSPTSFNVLVQCKRRYCFQYMLRLRESQEASEAASMGILAHEALQKAYEPYVGKLVNLADIDCVQKTCEQYLRAQILGNAIDRANIEILWLDLVGFFDFERKNIAANGAFEILGLEQELEDFVIEGYTFCRARVDRIQRSSDGKVLVIDYKYKNNFKDDKEDFALELYTIALSAKYGAVRAVYYDIKKAACIPQTEGKREKLVSTLGAIEGHFSAQGVDKENEVEIAYTHEVGDDKLTKGYGVFEAAEGSNPCQYCAYKSLCGR